MLTPALSESRSDDTNPNPADALNRDSTVVGGPVDALIAFFADCTPLLNIFRRLSLLARFPFMTDAAYLSMRRDDAPRNAPRKARLLVFSCAAFPDLPSSAKARSLPSEFFSSS